MTSKLFEEKQFQNFLNLCFQPKSSRKRTNAMFLKLFLNAMIRNMKIHNIYDIIEI
jgi:hypothetical protein